MNSKSQIANHISPNWKFGLGCITRQWKAQKGFVAISTVLIILSIVIAVGLLITYLAIGEGQSGLALTQGESTLSFVEGCAEDALLKARASATYAGGNITRPEGTCTVTVSKVSNTWTLTVTTTATTYARTIQVIITHDGYGDVISSWKEI